MHRHGLTGMATVIHTRNKPPRRDERRRARERKRCPDRLAKKMTPSGATPRAIVVLPPKQKPLSTREDFKTFSMMAASFCRHNCGKLKGPVCEDTFDNAFATHDETVGFVAPKFHDRLRFQAVDRYRNTGGGVVLGKMGHSVRLAAWRYPCLQHLAHPLHVKVQRVVPESHNGAKTMMQAASVRTSAHPTPSAYTPTAHTGDFNRDVLAIGNAENAIARVLFELRKPQPDNARALKLAQSAMLAIHLVGAEVQ